MSILRALPGRPSSGARGYAMLVMVGLLAAAALFALMTVASSGADTSETILATQQDLALAAAEAGLERTHAWLDAILAGGAVDFDRALDPLNDDACDPGPPFQVESGGADDHLPPFADGTALDLPGWSGGKRRYLSVAWPSAAQPKGAYFVRVDDNDDDRGAGVPGATNNNVGPGGGCREGSGLAPSQWSNPVRDRDRLVVVTVVGVSPGTDFARAHSRRTLRSVAGQREMPGLFAGGEVAAGGGSVSVCGPFASLFASGDVDLAGHQCGACGGLCAPSLVVAQTSAGVCNRSSGMCTPNVDPLRVHDLNPLDARWRPPACTAPAGCTPFYRLTVTVGAQLFMWSYLTCPDPRSPTLPDSCFTGGSCGGPSCWLDVSGNTVGGTNVFVDDGDPGLEAAVPSPASRLPPPDVFKIFHLQSAASGTCADSHGNSIPATVFRYDPYLPPPPGSPVLPLPHGVWIIDGSLELDIGGNRDMPYCPGGWKGAELLVRGSAIFKDRGYYLRPPPQMQAVLVVGGDLDLTVGTALVSSCGSGAAVAVREQVKGRGSNTIAAQLFVGNTASCFPDVLGTIALDLGGNARVEVESMPVLNLNPVTNLAWSESAL